MGRRKEGLVRRFVPIFIAGPGWALHSVLRRTHPMNQKRLFALSALLLASVPALAAAAKTYQVTGPIDDFDEKTISVKKGSETWEMQRDTDLKVKGELKKGDKVTIKYHMIADDAEVKGAAGAKGK